MIHTAPLLLLQIIPSYTIEHCFQAGSRVWRAHFGSFRAVPSFHCLCLQPFLLLNASYVFHVIWRHRSLNIKPCTQTLKTWGRKTIIQEQKATWLTGLRARCGFAFTYKATQPNVQTIHTHKGQQKHHVRLWVSVCACVAVCTRLQLRRDAMVIPSDLKTGFQPP